MIIRRKSMGLSMVLALMCVFLFGMPHPHSASAEVPADEATVEGPIIAIEVDGSIILKPDDSRISIVHMEDATKISSNGKPLKAENLKPGDRIWVRFDPSTHVAIEIQLNRNSAK